MMRFAFGPRNYRLMWAGLAVLAAGFITMSLDGAQYGEGFLGLTLGPVLLFIGFLLEFAAILVPSDAPALDPTAHVAPPATEAAVTAAPVAPTPTARPVVPPTPNKPTYKRP